MMTDRFHQYAQETLGAAGSTGITGVEAGVEGVPFGTRVLLAGGGQVHIQWVRSSSPGGDRVDGAERVVTGPVPEPVAVPPLEGGAGLPVVQVSRHIAALLHNGGSDELVRVDAYADVESLGSAAQPHGVRAVCHSGAQIFGLFRHILAAGAHASAEAAFRQRERV